MPRCSLDGMVKDDALCWCSLRVFGDLLTKRVPEYFLVCVTLVEYVVLIIEAGRFRSGPVGYP